MKVKQLIAGEDSSPILKRELLALDKSDRNKLLREVGMTIPPEQGLTTKADLAIPSTSMLRLLPSLLVFPVEENSEQLHMSSFPT